MAAEISVELPMLLGNTTGGIRQVTVAGDTLQQALDDLLRQYPLLKVHLYESQGVLRKHVLILYNGQNTRWFKSLDLPTQEGDKITVLQAVSGG
jgi:molybdopterin synthase sulfur carrier subunit